MSGDYRSGYLRLDDPQGLSRLELKWSQHKGRKPPDLHRVLDDYFRLVKRNFKKQGDLFIKRDIALVKDESFFEGREVVCFLWKGPIRAMGAIWYCHTCQRIVVAQVNGHLKENLRSLTVRILTSIRDHPTGYTQRWSAYGLNVEIPRRYRLDKQKLMSGYLLFSFADGSRKLAVERYGLAEILLKETDLEGWFRGTYHKDLRGYGFQIRPWEHDGDPGLALTGQETRLTDQIPFGVALALDKLARREALVAYAWHCKASHRLYVVRAIAKREAQTTAAQVAESIRCH